jgi:hypothetical protein
MGQVYSWTTAVGILKEVKLEFWGMGGGLLLAQMVESIKI